MCADKSQYLIRSIHINVLLADLLGSGRQLGGGDLLVVFAGDPEVHVLLAELRLQETREDDATR